MKQAILLISTFFFMISCASSYGSLGDGLSPKGETPGKCYARCATPSNSGVWIQKEVDRNGEKQMIWCLEEEDENSKPKIEWYEVMCEDALTENQLEKIRMALSKTGFPPNSSEQADVLDALQGYQNANELPVGGFNLASLQKLGLL